MLGSLASPPLSYEGYCLSLRVSRLDIRHRARRFSRHLARLTVGSAIAREGVAPARVPHGVREETVSTYVNFPIRAAVPVLWLPITERRTAALRD